MSLKAKLEAVIYAAEEPVTLAQLAVLFADDAFEWKAQQQAASAEQAAEGRYGPAQRTPLPAAQEVFASRNRSRNFRIQPDTAERKLPEAQPEPSLRGQPPRPNSKPAAWPACATARSARFCARCSTS